MIPTQLFEPGPRPQWFIAKVSGSFRYDLYPGDVTVGDVFTLHPYANKFLMVEAVPGSALAAFRVDVETMSDDGWRVQLYVNSGDPDPTKVRTCYL